MVTKSYQPCMLFISQSTTSSYKTQHNYSRTPPKTKVKRIGHETINMIKARAKRLREEGRDNNKMEG